MDTWCRADRPSDELKPRAHNAAGERDVRARGIDVCEVETPRRPSYVFANILRRFRSTYTGSLELIGKIVPPASTGRLLF